MGDLLKKEINDAIQIAIENCMMQIYKVDVQIPYLIGSPGGGKTECIHQLTSKLENCNVLSTHFAITPYEEHSGIPQFIDFKINGQDTIGTIWSFPAIMKRLYELSEKSNTVIWLLDDMHLCGAVHMALLYELLTERKLRDYYLPENVAIILAGNHGHNKAGSKTMFSAIANRVFMMPVFTSVEGWRENYAIQNNVHLAIQSFLKNSKYEIFLNEEEQTDTPWGSPRSWTRFANLLNVKEQWSKKKALDESDVLYLAQGHVSESAASEFVLYYKLFTKFNIPKIIDEYRIFELPESSIDQYALAYALCSHFGNVENIKDILIQLANIIYIYIKKAPDLGSIIIREIIDFEKLTNKRNISINLIKELNNIEPGITNNIVEEIQNV
jgi:hypothetical protein